MTTDDFTIGGDLRVNRLGFGAMRVTGSGVWGEPPDRREAVRVIRRAVELGINLIDTADAYGPEVSENLIAEAIHPYPANLVIATKGGYTRPGPNSWVPNGRPKHLKEACDGSLKRLKLDRIDLYQLHTPDPKVPLEESIAALADLREAGKIRHIGVSNFSADQLKAARAIVPIVSVQNNYNLAYRESEPVLDYCEAEGLGFIPYFPLGSGNLLRNQRLNEIATRLGATPGQIALAWLLRRSRAMLPIPGTSSLAHLEENTHARAVALEDADYRALDRAARSI
ncbi:MAG TPA: aldo/keto reductase [Candidatus Binataceae bacterium]|nr:aldo/keto reductase [Candidatus Binataceae bacterium]